MNTSGSSRHTLAVDVTKCVWLDILYLMHVLYVVYVTIGAPPPTSLVYYHKYTMCIYYICRPSVLYHTRT